MYLIATLELKYGKYADFVDLMPIIEKAMNKCGCKLIHAMAPVTGRLFNAIHIWEIPNIEVLEAIGVDESFLAILPALNDIVDQETMVFTQDAPYAPKASH